MSIRSLHLKVERREAIARSVIEEGLSVAVAPGTVSNWVERFRQNGAAGLRTRPRKYPLKTPPEKIELIKVLRKQQELPIARISAETGVKPPTVASLLRRLRLTKSRKRRPEGWWMPSERAHMARQLSWLSSDQKAAIVEEIRTGEVYPVIAERWLVSPSRIASIAREVGVHRNRSSLRKLLAPDQQQALLEKVRRGMSANQLARQLNLHSESIRRFARSMGVKRQNNKRDLMRNSMPHEKVDMILSQCRFSRANYEEIGKPFGLTHQEVSWLALQHGIRRRHR
jgi:transposase